MLYPTPLFYLFDPSFFMTFVRPKIQFNFLVGMERTNSNASLNKDATIYDFIVSSLTVFSFLLLRKKKVVVDKQVPTCSDLTPSPHIGSSFIYF